MLGKNKRHSISAQFFLLLVLSGTFCTLLFLGLRLGVDSLLTHYFIDSDFEERIAEKRITDFQEYVTENSLTVNDTQELLDWTRGKPLILLEIYRSNVLVFTSYAPGNEALENNSEEVPYYDWMSYYVVDFADGSAEVLLYCDDVFRLFTYATIGEVVLCTLLFLLIFLVGNQRIVRYIRQLRTEIQAMEAGDLNSGITISGNNDLTALAESLDAMRITLRTQQEQTAWTYAANQTLISEMSHDLRTPLTALLIYTEILRYGKYQGEEQLASYLNKIDAKAQQIKQLSENILEYSLAARGHSIELEVPTLAREVFTPYLEEAVFHLNRCGFTCETDFQLHESPVAVHSPFLRRIIDNLVSNISKYAKPDEPVKIKAWKQEAQVLLSFENTVDQDAGQTESTCIGLSSVRTMMEKMRGTSTVEQTGSLFRVTLHFPSAPRENRDSPGT